MNNIKLEEFNDCPGKKVVEEYLKDNNIIGLGNGFTEVKDAFADYYKNKEDTLVLRLKDIKKFELTFQNGLDIASLQRQFNADEFRILHEGGYIYFRFWWD